jgi:hypothetical protein
MDYFPRGHLDTEIMLLHWIGAGTLERHGREISVSVQRIVFMPIDTNK